MPRQNFNKYYVAELYQQKFHTASVRLDNEKILAEEGYKELKFRHYEAGSLFIKFSRLLNAFYFLITCPRKSIVIFHFPFHATAYKFLQKILKWKQIKTVALIIDIEGIRNQDDKLLQDEILELDKFDFLVVHNKPMLEALSKSISSKKMFTIEIFDYPFQLPTALPGFEKSICIAANFTKGKYIYQLNKLKGLRFYLYGQGFHPTSVEGSNIFYQGIFDAGGLINNLQGSFGLVWDGTSIDTCDGDSGKYLRYNNPYKLSLYIAAGLPVITWKESAIASFIEKNSIGLTVNSLFEVEGMLQQLSKEDYLQMQQNTVALSQKVKSGYFLNTVMQKIIEEAEN